MTDADTLAELCDVSARYGDALALSHVSLALARAELCAVVGANGSGKSTLLRLLAGRAVPASGLLRYNPSLGESGRERSRAIGYAAQTPELDPEMSGREHLELFAALCRLPESSRGARIDQLSRQLGLESFLDQRVDTYSGGMRQRLHIALSMLHAPMLLLLDEPFQGLDPEAQVALWEALAQHTQGGGSALVVSHDLARTANTADRVAILDAGRLLALASPSALAHEHGSLEQAYEKLTGRRVRDLAGPMGGRGRGPRA